MSRGSFNLGIRQLPATPIGAPICQFSLFVSHPAESLSPNECEMKAPEGQLALDLRIYAIALWLVVYIEKYDRVFQLKRLINLEIAVFVSLRTSKKYRAGLGLARDTVQLLSEYCH